MMQDKVVTILKLAALTIGSSIFMLTSLFWLHELDYDHSHPDHERLYRYVHRVKTGETLESLALTSATTGPALEEYFPEVEATARLVFPAVSVSNVNSDASFNERRFGFADPSFLQIFNFPVRESADPSKLLSTPYTVIITTTTAQKYFGTTDVVGKTLMVNGTAEFVIKGVFKPDLAPSHIHFDFIAPLSTFESIRNHPVLSGQIPLSKNLETKGIAAFYTYVKLAPNILVDELTEKFPEFIETTRGQGRSERLKPTLQPVSSIHLESSLIYEIQPNGSRAITNAYLFVGALILAIACINYINTSTAEFIRRQRSVELKKILGVSRRALMFAHLVETFVFAFIALFIGFISSMMFLPVFNVTAGRQIAPDLRTILFLLMTVLALIVVASGIFPAVRISGLNPLATLRGRHAQSGPVGARQILVFLQVLCSFCLLTMSLLMYTQFDYMLHRDMGFNTRNTLVVAALSADPAIRTLFRNDVSILPGVLSAAQCSSPPGKSFMSYGVRHKQADGDPDHPMSVWQSFVDQYYVETMGITMTSGRFFDLQNPADSSTHVVVNQAAAAILGAQPIDQQLNLPDVFKNTRVEKTVVGVVRDFHFASLHSAIEPLVLEYNPARCGYVVIHFDRAPGQEAVSSVSKLWKERLPSIPFDYYFLEDGIAALYGNEQRQKDVMAMIACISVCLTALGIFGATMFLAQSRTKEMGIRKILGSGKDHIMILLFRPIIILLLVSCVAGIPLAFIAGVRWLEQYPYRVDFSPAHFITAFGIILFVTAATVLKHFLRVTGVNPVNVLRDNN